MESNSSRIEIVFVKGYYFVGGFELREKRLDVLYSVKMHEFHGSRRHLAHGWRQGTSVDLIHIDRVEAHEEGSSENSPEILGIINLVHEYNITASLDATEVIGDGRRS